MSCTQDLRALPESVRAVQTAACAAELEVVIEKVDAGHVQARWAPPPRFLNGHGVIQGGFASAACDFVMAAAVASMLPAGKMFTSVNLALTYHKPLAPKSYVILADIVRLGRRTAYAEAEIRQGEKLLVSANGSLLVLEKSNSNGGNEELR